MFAAVLFSPLLIGIINKVKAFFAGRKGPRLLQFYYDIFKLLKRSSVYSSSSTWLFKVAPWGALAASILMLMLLPAACVKSPAAFPGDLILFIYLAGFGRMMTVLAAMETASAFEGMGASRECQFSLLAEGVIFTVLAALVMLTKDFTLSGCLTTLKPEGWSSGGTAILFMAVAFYIVMLCENCRVPVDDPETHLELTMIHEAMVLDQSGPQLAFMSFSGMLKVYLFASFIISLILAACRTSSYYWLFFILGIIIISVIVGLVESLQARLRMVHVQQYILFSAAISLILLLSVIIFKV